MARKSNSFLKNIFILLVSQVFIKILGFIYTIYLINKKGFADEGNAIYLGGYQIYATIVVISVIGIPSSLSKLISEKYRVSDFDNLNKIYNISFMFFSMCGFLIGILVFVFSDSIASKVLQIPGSSFGLKVLAPAIFFVTSSSVIKGYLIGIDRIDISAKTQFLEQIFKTLLTIVFVKIVSDLYKNTVVMATAASFAITMATFISFVYMWIAQNRVEENKINVTLYNFNETKNTLKKVFKIVFPVTANSVVSSLGKNIDALTVVRSLKLHISENFAIIKYGIITSKVDVLSAIPMAFNSAITTSLVPEVAKSAICNDFRKTKSILEKSIIISMIIAIPASFGMFFYAEDIFKLLFPNALEGFELLKIASFGIIFSILNQNICAFFQGIGKNKIPIIGSSIGIFCKIILNIGLVSNSILLEKGVIIANVISTIISFFILKNYLNEFLHLEIFKKTFIIFLNSVIMIFVSKKIKKILLMKCINFKISIILTIASAIVIYAILEIVTKLLNKTLNSKTLENTSFLEQ